MSLIFICDLSASHVKGPVTSRGRGGGLQTGHRALASPASLTPLCRKPLLNLARWLGSSLFLSRVWIQPLNAQLQCQSMLWDSGLYTGGANYRCSQLAVANLLFMVCPWALISLFRFHEVWGGSDLLHSSPSETPSSREQVKFRGRCTSHSQHRKEI